MSTLGAMKTRIADEISRADLGAQIGYAISDAIAKYQRIRFFFNETGPSGSTFSTVANRADYTASDNADIPYFYDLDDLFVIISNNNYRVRRIEPTMFTLLSLPSIKGQPYQFMYTNQTLSLFPIPDRVYPMFMFGHYRLAGPASDTEANNHWMTDAERLIRNCAKRLLYQEILLDGDGANSAGSAETEALDDLKAATAGMIRTGAVEPMQF
jgi:hypothetical protein